MLPPQEVYDLIKQFCTVDQIKQVLREFKKEATPEQKKDVRVSGTEDEVVKNLKFAVAHGRIPPKDVYDLLSESEENGDQHIFYFRPRSSAAKSAVKDGNALASALWGKKWKDAMSFPRFQLVPNSLEWADFRMGDGSRKAGDWVGKLYSQEEIQRKTGERRRGNVVVKRFKVVLVRTVCAVRWNSPDLLEVRIARSENKSQVALNRRLDSIWGMVSGVLDRSGFDPWPVTDITRGMLKRYADNPKDDISYEAGDTTLQSTDGGGVELFSPDEEVDLFSAVERRDTMKTVLNHGASCRQSVISWLPKKSGGSLEKPLRMIVGGHSPNEIIIQSRVSSKAVDYVTDQLRHYS